MSDDILSSQFDFLIAADRLKLVQRKTSIMDGSRKENSAEHSWHLILTAMTLAKYANEPIDLLKVMQMFALHDLGEIESGDTFHYHKTADTNRAEKETVRSLFSFLPADQQSEFMALWSEFDEGKTAEAKFAQALDRIWPILQNHANGGGTWVEFGLSIDRIYDRNRHIDEGSQALWAYAKQLIENVSAAGLLTV